MARTFDLATDIRSLTDFKRNTNEFSEQLKSTGRPLVLTVNGKAELVVQDAAAYQAMLEMAERVATLEGIQRGLDQMERGEGRPADEVFAEIRSKFSINPGQNDSE